ncbi:hypothetical protein F5888DRAFT_116066 [Russula emetica]|nr:hypothetical protein F5888DRAFT_116066 [Russula emetica]
MAFFELQKGGRKANNAQKEKRRLARKRSRAAKREREREAAKAAKQPPRERQCVACGRKFNSRKTASKHKCPKSKVERMKGEAAGGQASQATPTAKLDKPPAKFTPTAPTPPSNINSPPVVTGDSQDNSQRYIPIVYIQTGSRLRILREDWQKYWETGLWRLG